MLWGASGEGRSSAPTSPRSFSKSAVSLKPNPWGKGPEMVSKVHVRPRSAERMTSDARSPSRVTIAYTV